MPLTGIPPIVHQHPTVHREPNESRVAETFEKRRYTPATQEDHACYADEKEQAPVTAKMLAEYTEAKEKAEKEVVAAVAAAIRL